MGVTYDDLDGHEGYAARRLADGTLTSSWTTSTAAFNSYVPKCECGWSGTDHVPTDDGYEDAMDEWDEVHAQPLLARAVPVEVRELLREAKQSLNQLSKERPHAALGALEDLAASIEVIVVRLRGTGRSSLPRS